MKRIQTYRILTYRKDVCLYRDTLGRCLPFLQWRLMRQLRRRYIDGALIAYHDRILSRIGHCGK